MVGFWRYQNGFLVVIALLPLIYFLQIAQKRKLSAKKVITVFWLSGLVGYLGIMAWVLSIRPETWSGIEGKVPLMFVVAVWLVSGLALSVGPLLFAFFITRPKKLNLQNSSIIILLPAAWVVSEYARSWILSLTWYGSNGTLGAHWNFGTLGLGLAATPLATISRLVGLYGLTFLAVSLNITIYWLLKRQFKQSAIVLGAVSLILVISQVAYRPEGRSARVGIVQLPNSRNISYQQLAKKLEDNSKQRVDILVLPEYANFFESTPTETSQQILTSVFGNQKGVGIYSREHDDSYGQIEKQRTDQTVYFNERGEILATQDKWFLIPHGEYLPTTIRLVLGWTGHEALIGDFNRARALKKAEHPERVISYNNTKVGAIACSGIVSPALYRSLANKGADVLVNTASLNIFRSSEYFQQTKMLARFNAVANNRPFAQATQDGYSYLINSDGQFLLETIDKNLNYITAETTMPNHQTLYSKFGDFVVFLSVVTLAIIARREKWQLHK